VSTAKTFLLELHCEEIPARFLKSLSEELDRKIQDHLGTWLNCDSAYFQRDKQWGVFYSPRKIAVRLANIPVSQSDQTETQVGPPQRMCVDEAGKPTIQGLKFAENEAGFNRFAESNVVGNKEVDARHLERLLQGLQLVGHDLDAGAVRRLE